jgi:uncharacterized protein (TIGR02646 family)
MHSVDRGAEPTRLRGIRRRHTPRWVTYYRHHTGPQPTDSYWRTFRNEIGIIFCALCGYCELPCRGEVEHFRPKTRYPHLVYVWGNWVFSCHDCNGQKGAKWPTGGYVDPCASSAPDRAENHFEFDTLTGRILPKSGLTPARRARALKTIDDLELNAYHHLVARLNRIRLLSVVLQNRSPGDPDVLAMVQEFARRTTELSSVTRFRLLEMGFQL